MVQNKKLKCENCGYEGPVVEYSGAYICSECLKYERKAVVDEARLHRHSLTELEKRLRQLNKLLRKVPERPLPDIQRVLSALERSGVGDTIDKNFNPVELVSVRFDDRGVKVKSTRYKHPTSLYICYLLPKIFIAMTESDDDPPVFERLLYFGGVITDSDLFVLRLRPLNSITKQFHTYLKMTGQEGVSLRVIRRWALK